ncbi:hypothetical protein ACFQQB_36560 [Nonomuraea rubra]|uniref:hypothetical protein n=1 Tax=Nonomuraea rubra TaxID=46180 RepID=UPI0031E56D7D
MQRAVRVVDHDALDGGDPLGDHVVERDGHPGERRDGLGAQDPGDLLELAVHAVHQVVAQQRDADDVGEHEAERGEPEHGHDEAGTQAPGFHRGVLNV